METLEMQVGGDYYKRHMGLQPWDLVRAYGLGYWTGNALKYILRTKLNRAEDLRKGAHYLEHAAALIEAGEEMPV